MRDRNQTGAKVHFNINCQTEGQKNNHNMGHSQTGMDNLMSVYPLLGTTRYVSITCSPQCAEAVQKRTQTDSKSQKEQG